MSDSDSPPPSGASDAVAAEAKPEKPKDVVFVHGQTPNGLGIARLRTDGEGDERIELGELRPLKEGQPLLGEVVRLSRREESDRLFDVEVLMKAREDSKRELTERESGPRKGPPKVSSNAFRLHWDDVFGAKPKRDPLPS
ncbi:MAG: hypothetical protein U0414_05315 [Polyangiaceae bacterium]